MLSPLRCDRITPTILRVMILSLCVSIKSNMVSVILLSVFMLSVAIEPTMLSVIIVIVFMLNVSIELTIPSVVLPRVSTVSVVRLRVIMLNVVAPEVVDTSGGAKK